MATTTIDGLVGALLAKGWRPLFVSEAGIYDCLGAPNSYLEPPDPRGPEAAAPWNDYHW